MGNGKKKAGVSINVCIGTELFSMLDEYCELTGQSKTVAVERAIAYFCSQNKDQNGDSQAGDGKS